MVQVVFYFSVIMSVGIDGSNSGRMYTEELVSSDDGDTGNICHLKPGAEKSN